MGESFRERERQDVATAASRDGFTAVPEGLPHPETAATA
jgi:hypothetical protein